MLTLKEFDAQCRRFSASHSEWQLHESGSSLFRDDALPKAYITRTTMVNLRSRSSIDDSLSSGLDSDWGVEEYVDPAGAMETDHTAESDGSYVTLETHIWYNVVYQVPQIGLIAVDIHGNRVEIDDRFIRSLSDHRLNLEPNRSAYRPSVDVGQHATEYPPMLLEPHPHTGNLVFALHPCRTMDIMRPVGQSTYLESFVNFMEQCLSL